MHIIIINVIWLITICHRHTKACSYPLKQKHACEQLLYAENTTKLNLANTRICNIVIQLSIIYTVHKEIFKAQNFLGWNFFAIKF